MASQDNKFRNKSLLDSFRCALNGWGFIYKTERNVRAQTLVGFLAVLAGIYFKISQIEWCILVLCIGMVIVTEMTNTAVEKAVDLACGEKYHELAKVSKDAMAGAVLFSALVSVVVGILIFGPRVIALLK